MSQQEEGKLEQPSEGAQEQEHIQAEAPQQERQKEYSFLEAYEMLSMGDQNKNLQRRRNLQQRFIFDYIEQKTLEEYQSLLEKGTITGNCINTFEPTQDSSVSCPYNMCELNVRLGRFGSNYSLKDTHIVVMWLELCKDRNPTYQIIDQFLKAFILTDGGLNISLYCRKYDEERGQGCMGSSNNGIALYNGKRLPQFLNICYYSSKGHIYQQISYYSRVTKGQSPKCQSVPKCLIRGKEAYPNDSLIFRILQNYEFNSPYINKSNSKTLGEFLYHFTRFQLTNNTEPLRFPLKFLNH